MSTWKSYETAMMNHFDVADINETLLTSIKDMGEKIFGDKLWRDNISVPLLQKLFRVLNMADYLEDEHPHKLLVMTQIFRFCRQACVYSAGNQEAVGFHSDIGEFAVQFAKKYLIKLPSEEYPKEKSAALSSALKMIYNSLTFCKRVCDYYCDSLRFTDDLRVYVKSSFQDVVEAGVLGAMQVCKMRPSTEVFDLPNMRKMEGDDAYTSLYMYALCTIESFMIKEFSNKSRATRIGLLERITCLSDRIDIDEDVFENLMSRYKSLCAYLLDAEKAEQEEEFLEELKWLVLLMTNYAVSEQYKEPLEWLRSDPAFVAFSIEALSKIHEVGKQEGNMFTPIDKLDMVAPNGTGDAGIEKLPSYMLKIRLITLITHLCSEHQSNQNMVGATDGLSVILNCTKIDARNPLLPQYAILALKCLLTGNQRNQEFIEKMKKQGYTENAILTDFGIQIEKKAA